MLKWSFILFILLNSNVGQATGKGILEENSSELYDLWIECFDILKFKFADLFADTKDKCLLLRGRSFKRLLQVMNYVLILCIGSYIVLN